MRVFKIITFVSDCSAGKRNRVQNSKYTLVVLNQENKDYPLNQRGVGGVGGKKLKNCHHPHPSYYQNDFGVISTAPPTQMNGQNKAQPGMIPESSIAAVAVPAHPSRAAATVRGRISDSGWKCDFKLMREGFYQWKAGSAYMRGAAAAMPAASRRCA